LYYQRVSLALRYAGGYSSSESRSRVVTGAKRLSKKLVELKTAGIAGIICLPDNDDPGTQKTNKVATAASIAGMPLVIILH
jgi:protein tyrosine phosphatase (PTP) superfamily phosphohydrolase (DUF442 family)